MLKSSLIKLRRQPKVVREQVALLVAGVFTFAIFGVWALTLPGRFSDAGVQTAGVVDTLTESIVEEDTIEFENLSEDFRALKETITNEVKVESNVVNATTSVQTETSVATTSLDKEVRIITTSSSSNLQSEGE